MCQCKYKMSTSPWIRNIVSWGSWSHPALWLLNGCWWPQVTCSVLCWCIQMWFFFYINPMILLSSFNFNMLKCSWAFKLSQTDIFVASLCNSYTFRKHFQLSIAFSFSFAFLNFKPLSILSTVFFDRYERLSMFLLFSVCGDFLSNHNWSWDIRTCFSYMYLNVIFSF